MKKALTLADSHKHILRSFLYFLFTAGFLSLAFISASQSKQTQHRENFVAITDINPTILVEMRYYGSHNFIGKPVPGYVAHKCLLTHNAALALSAVQKELNAKKLTLKIYDCYRPQRAVNYYARWAKDPRNMRMKEEFYPNVEKKNLFSDGYIAEKSGHSRGSTVDLTIVPLPVPVQEVYNLGDPLRACFLPADQRFGDNSLNMGTGYDCFDPRSHTLSPHIGGEQKNNRVLLKKVMEKHGFVNYPKEWWHYTLQNEPFPHTYFNFNVE